MEFEMGSREISKMAASENGVYLQMFQSWEQIEHVPLARGTAHGGCYIHSKFHGDPKPLPL